MCNAYEQQVTYAQYRDAIRAAELVTPDSESESDLPRAEIRIGDMGPVLRAAGNGAKLVLMRFGWPASRPKAPPVFNFRSDNRHFDESRRCVIVLSGFFEFTGSKSPKTKHRFRLKDSPVMGIAGLWSEDDEGALSFTLLTTAPGPDIAPIHDRQVCVLRPEQWAHWLFLTKPEAELLVPLPEGTLTVEIVRP
ncbi:MAG: SOS response-associated peptidase [Devosia sp.]|uniref:SOS response-associated peptidase n=1 Tax=Devosia sp. TaxID=1871048 RepID=UPI001AC3C01D|nr:SOS response-associated peptidase [Devosia sp.]MBN9316171.1 SOS response-associated peptidase [Devosia sp.]